MPAWSDEQLEVINERGCELLVSAAAGSGKTSVLVERIYKRITDESDPKDIDRFVVVTFTKAAAAEMKQKLRKRMDAALASESLTPSMREHVRRQYRRLSGAHISTVHSFCNYIIGQYFHRIGLDPSYRELVGAEYELLKNDVMNELIENEYEEAKDDFIKLVDIRELNKSDQKLETWIYDVYSKMISEPFPDLVYDRWESILSAPLESDKSPYIGRLISSTGVWAKEALETVKQLHYEYGDAYKNKDENTVLALIDITEKIYDTAAEYKDGKIDKINAYNRIKDILSVMELSGLPKDENKNNTKERNYVIRTCSPIRNRLGSMQGDDYHGTIENKQKDQDLMRDECLTVMRLAREFDQRFRQAKRDRGVLDFSDLEQYSLQILYDRDENGMPVRSDAAKELSESFVEIMIDEYQDSNRVQDAIFWSVARSDNEDEGKLMPWERAASNRFMVGDIKQSIYRFRGACPSLFEEKLKSFSHEKGAKRRRIDLHKNFRSRRNIIDGTNAVFKLIMSSDIGGVDYDEDAMLSYGANISSAEDGKPVAQKIYIDYYDRSGAVCPKEQVEAYHIGRRIEEMVHGDDPLYIEDGEKGYRRVTYRDIVILSHAVSPIAYTYTEVFKSMGIPFFTHVDQGFYGTREVTLIVELLKVIDNPHQDIPLAGVLLGPLWLDEIQLGTVRAFAYENRARDGRALDMDLYDIIRFYADETNADRTDDEIRNTLIGFLGELDKLREMSRYAPLSSVVEYIYDNIGYMDVFATQPDGERRAANLEYLLELVLDYDTKNRHDIHGFTDYLAKIERNNVDTGEPVSIGDGENVVRLMTVHKSKGLEFPVVFIARAASPGKDNEVLRFVFDDDLGIAARIESDEYGWTKNPLAWKLISEKNMIDDRGEKMRLLYVAMTRAKDQLIFEHYVSDKNEPEVSVGFAGRMAMKAFGFMIKPALRLDTDEHIFVKSKEIYSMEYWLERDRKSGARIEDESDISEENAIFDTSDTYNDDIKELLEELDRDRDEDGAHVLPAKISVSDIKKESMEDEGHISVFSSADEEDEYAAYPDFMRPDSRKGLTGAMRGTIYHQAMASIDMAALYGADTPDPDIIGKALETAVAQGKLAKADMDVIKTADIVRFFESDLGKRMIAADARGELFREQPFILSVRANTLKRYADEDDDKRVMIQGVIDAYFFEGDDIILMDYKTDRVNDESELTGRYRIQLELYKSALERSTGRSVGGAYLYSFCIGAEIAVG